MSREQAAPDASATTGTPARAGELGAARPVRPVRAWLASLRPIHWALIALVLILFLAISGLLARFFATENVERDDILAVLRAETVGNERGMLAQLSGCAGAPKCVAVVKADAAYLHRGGSVKILDLTSESNHSLGNSTGPTRVAWTVIGHLPTVQCVTVRRSGNFFTGISVALLSIGRPINSEADC
ncbi:MAG: hypothetical protein WB998_14590 [Solirubrobacteraceae bacterium]